MTRQHGTPLTEYNDARTGRSSPIAATDAEVPGRLASLDLCGHASVHSIGLDRLRLRGGDLTPRAGLRRSHAPGQHPDAAARRSHRRARWRRHTHARDGHAAAARSGGAPGVRHRGVHAGLAAVPRLHHAGRSSPSGSARRPTRCEAVEASLRAHGLHARPAQRQRAVDPGQRRPPERCARAFVDVVRARDASRTAPTAIVNQQAPALDSSDRARRPGRPRPRHALDGQAAARPPAHRDRAALAAKPHVVTGGPQPCAAASQAGTSQGGFTADQIASAYGLSGLYAAGGPGGAADEGAGQTVAILELEPYDPNDIAAYEQCYGVNALVANVPVDGGAGTGAGSGEAALDIENVIGLAPAGEHRGLRGAELGRGPVRHVQRDHHRPSRRRWSPRRGGSASSLDGFSQAVGREHPVPGGRRPGDVDRLRLRRRRRPRTASPTNPTPQVDDPASQPFVTGVGGTTRANALGARPGETVWNDGPTVGASGGGISTLLEDAGLPDRGAGVSARDQRRLLGRAVRGHRGRLPRGARRVGRRRSEHRLRDLLERQRQPPDPRAPAGWQVVGGTSGAAPAWAALIALTNASSPCSGTAVGFANPALYNAAANAYAADFNDITSGNNDMTGTNGGQFAAGPGYDMATGLGSPNGSSLAGALCTDAISLANPGAQRSTLHSAGQPPDQGRPTPAGQACTYSATGLPAGLSIDTSTGKITGRPSRLGTSTVTDRRIRSGRDHVAAPRSPGRSRPTRRSRACRCPRSARPGRGCRSRSPPGAMRPT